MTTPAGMIRKLELLNISAEVVKILELHKEAIKAANKQQWKLGKKADSTQIGKYASVKYGKAKFALNTLAGEGNIDLILTQKTINSLTVNISASTINFKLGSDEHNLETRFGSEILGLTDNSKKGLIQILILPELLEDIRSKIGMQ